jgi:hypothetical protein
MHFVPQHVRGYLKSTGGRAWRLVNWLTHAANATREDAELALSVASHVINNYALSVLKRKIQAPERCAPMQVLQDHGRLAT